METSNDINSLITNRANCEIKIKIVICVYKLWRCFWNLVLESILKAYGLRLELGTWGVKGKLEMWGDIMDEMDIWLDIATTKLLMKILEITATRLQL
jgi:hypothetical protein